MSALEASFDRHKAHLSLRMRHVSLPCMSDQESDAGQVKQRMDAMLRRLAKMPPQSRDELAEAVRRAKEEKRTRAKGKSQAKKTA